MEEEGAALRIVRKVARQAGITKKLGPHTLRHAFITAAHQSGCRGACNRSRTQRRACDLRFGRLTDLTVGQLPTISDGLLHSGKVNMYPYSRQVTW